MKKKILIISAIILTVGLLGWWGLSTLKTAIRQMFMWENRREFSKVLNEELIPQAKQDSISFREIEKIANQLFVDVAEMKKKKNWKKVDELQCRKDSILHELTLLSRRDRQRDSIVCSYKENFYNRFNEPLIKE